MVTKSQINLINILQTLSKKLNLKVDSGTSNESQENYRMMKEKFGNEDFSFEVFLPTAKANVSNDLIVSIRKETIDAYCPDKLRMAVSTNFFLVYSWQNAEITRCFKKENLAFRF